MILKFSVAMTTILYVLLMPHISHGLVEALFKLSPLQNLDCGRGRKKRHGEPQALNLLPRNTVTSAHISLAVACHTATPESKAAVILTLPQEDKPE